MEFKLVCAVCGTDFSSMRKHTKTCSPKCNRIRMRKIRMAYYRENKGHINSLHREYIRNWQRTHKDAMNSYTLRQNRMKLLKLLIKMGFSEKTKELLMRERPIFRDIKPKEVKA
jgi:protein-arginine kinase activator protein McsA